eukprot:gene27691-7333_t
MIGMRSQVSMASSRRACASPRMGSRVARRSLCVAAASMWSLEPDTMFGQEASKNPSVALEKLWADLPNRCIVAPNGMNVVSIASSTSTIDPTLATFNYHGASTAGQMVQVKPDYFHASKAHAVIVIEGDDRDESATISLQRGDRSSMQVKLNGRLLKIEKKTPLKVGDLITMPDVEYRVTKK